MKKLRSIHLYLGCIFAPLLLFFAVSGIWQTLGVQSNFLTRLSTIHTSHQLKNGTGLTSRILILFVVLMAVSFIITTVLGVLIAIQHGGSRRAAFCCLTLGVVIPGVLVLCRLVGIQM